MAQIQSGNPQNNPTDKSLRTRSTFPLQYIFYGTYRFGHIMPHFAMEGVSSDEVHLRSSHEVRSFNLKAPLMEDVALKKDYFAVPMTAILPLNWDKFYTNPVIGGDVPTDCGPSLSGFYAKVANWLGIGFTSLKAALSDSSVTLPQIITGFVRIESGERKNGTIIAHITRSGIRFRLFDHRTKIINQGSIRN